MGPLVPDPQGRLDLPEGFSYAVLDRSGQTMSDGYRVPGLPDGMACFPGPNGTLVLLRNHELTFSSGGPYDDSGIPPFGIPPREAYDPAFAGGVSRLVVDATTYARVSSNLVLVGTARNCAGGPSPWGWLSCEESFDPVHGYVFLCPTSAATVAPPQRIVGYGHFRHEGVAIDPAGNVAYLTEDRSDSALYRFVPDDPRAPFVGTLQALRVRGRSAFDTAAGLRAGESVNVDWVDLPDPDPQSDTLRATARTFGAARVSRGEGIWYDRGVVYFTSTDGGPVGCGQVFALRPTKSGGTLTLVAQSEAPDELDGPDNVCTTPFGDVFVCEDGFQGSENFIRGITPSGGIYDFARTTLSELAGACFSPDGRALFVNIFGADTTLVVTGPFPTGDPDGGGGGAGDSGGHGGHGGDSDGAGTPNGGRAGKATGGEPGRGGSSRGGSNATGGSRGTNEPGGGAGTPDGGDGGDGASGRGGTSGIVTGPARPADTGDDPGCGCSVPGRR